MSIRIASPNISATLTEVTDMASFITDALGRHDELAHIHFKNGTLYGSAFPGKRVDFCGCLIERCTLDCQKDKGYSFVDVVFKNCDLSNADFFKSTFLRVSFVDCKALGTNFPEAVFNNVTVSQSVFRYANFSAAKITCMSFESSDLSNCAFEQCKLKSFHLSRCSLDSAEFSFTPLKGIDLTTCNIRGIKANLLDLRCAIVATHQMTDLAGLLGVVICDPLPEKEI